MDLPPHVAVLQELTELCEDLVAGLSTEAGAHAAAKLQAISSIGRLLPGGWCSLLPEYLGAP
jgi:hypothetical protein